MTFRKSLPELTPLNVNKLTLENFRCLHTHAARAVRHGGGYHVVRLKMPMVRSGLIISCMYRDMSRLRIRHGNSFSTFVMLRARSRCCIHCPCLILLVSVAATMACHVRRGVRMCVSMCVSVCVCVCVFVCVFRVCVCVLGNRAACC